MIVSRSCSAHASTEWSLELIRVNPASSLHSFLNSKDAKCSVLLTLTQLQRFDTHSRVNKYNLVLLLQVLTGSKGESLGSKMEVEEEGGEVAATGISVHSLAGAACGDMAEEKHRD